MSKWTWIDKLTRQEIETHLDGVGLAMEEAEKLLHNLKEARDKLRFRHNKLRRDAGEL